jgi:hypothetical protein
MRKPLSKLLIEEIKAAEAEKEKLDKEQKDEDGEAVSGEGDAEEKSKTKDKETKRTEARDWKRNGVLNSFYFVTSDLDLSLQTRDGLSGWTPKLHF